MTASPALFDGGPALLVRRPGVEGANIRTWIGFKHFMYLVEECVLQYFHDRGTSVGALYHRHGLGMEIVDCSVQLPHALELEDEARVTVHPAPRQKPGTGAAFTAQITVDTPAGPAVVLKGKVRVAFVREKDAPGSEPVPPALEPFVVPEVAALTHTDDGPGRVLTGSVADVLTPPGSGAYLWSWRIPYFYCHYSDRLQHSAYVRTLEEVVDRFLHDRGLAIGTLLSERGWIPVVSRARVHMLADAHMEETVHTVFTVQDVLKGVSWTATMDCYVQRGDRLVHTATGSIMHGYSLSRGERAGHLAELDEATTGALMGVRA